MPIHIKNFEVTIDGATYRAENVKRVSLPESKRRLILTLTRILANEVDDGEAFLARVKTFRKIFAHKFPDAAKFRQTTQIFPDSSDWKYTLRDAQGKHMEWAQVAKKCGLIDSFVVDYDPED